MTTQSPSIYFPQATPSVRSVMIPEAHLNELATIIERRTLMQFGAERRDLLVGTLASLANNAGAREAAT